MSVSETGWLALTIPISQLIFTICYFFLDTEFLEFYTFVNCKVSLAGSMSTRQRENRNNGNQESSSKEASEEGSQENSKKEVSSQRNRQHNRGTPKASPDVLLGEVESPVFMRLRRLLRPTCEFFSRAWAENFAGLQLSIARVVERISASAFPWFRTWRGAWTVHISRRPAVAAGPLRMEITDERLTRKRLSLLKWYFAMTPSEDTVTR